MTLLHLIRPDGTFKSEEFKGKLEFKAPSFEYMYGILACDIIEHVSVLWKGRHCHLFVDENGRAKDLPRNERATRIYYNATLKREKRLSLIYDRLDLDPIPLSELFFQEDPGFYIVGPACLWEGELE